jgi:hypothetical protein
MDSYRHIHKAIERKKELALRFPDEKDSTADA